MIRARQSYHIERAFLHKIEQLLEIIAVIRNKNLNGRRMNCVIRCM